MKFVKKKNEEEVKENVFAGLMHTPKMRFVQQVEEKKEGVETGDEAWGINRAKTQRKMEEVIEEVEKGDFTLKITKNSVRLYYGPKLIRIFEKEKLSAYDLAEAISWAIISDDWVLKQYEDYCKEHGIMFDPAIAGRVDFDELRGFEIALSLAKKVRSIEMVGIDAVKKHIERINEKYEEE
jgi:hypothetical protein